MNKIERLKAQIEKIKDKIVDYEVLFEEDGTIDDREQKVLDKLNGTIAKIEDAIEDKRATLTGVLGEVYNDYVLLYDSIKDKIEEESFLDKNETRILKKMDKTLKRFLTKYSKCDLDTQKELTKEKDKLDELNEVILGFKEKAGVPVKDISNQSSNPQITPKSKKYVKGYKDISKRATKAIVDLFQKGEMGDIDRNNDIHHNDVRQGYLGDCYFLSAVAAVANANPQAIRDLIRPKGDGTFDVRLYVRDKKFLSWSGLNPVIVNVTAEIATTVDNNGDEVPIYADIGDKELWVPLVEKAYAKLNGTKYKSKYKKIEGGYGTWGIESVTGKQASSFNPKKKTKEEVVAIIGEALKDQRPITVATKYKLNSKKKWEMSNGVKLVALHEYYVLDINDSEIKLRNPHNIDNTESYAYYGGNEFKITIDEFIKYFIRISLQI